eukprot:GHVU01206606.1.p1 GENE.GHVU01206606.1~~GHVU01206606.1.p1  ORF type:complete len:102 (+),score=1.26 GHVU01206606.1:189-494(+)
MIFGNSVITRELNNRICRIRSLIQEPTDRRSHKSQKGGGVTLTCESTNSIGTVEEASVNASSMFGIAGSLKSGPKTSRTRFTLEAKDRSGLNARINKRLTN